MLTGELEIEVTKDDINQGKQSVGGSCPIALALKRKFGDLEWNVDVDCIRYYDEDGDIEYITMSSQGAEFVELFDLEGPDAVTPFTLKLLAE